MRASRSERSEAYVDKTRAELRSLVERGGRFGGNAFSSVLFLKGVPSPSETDGAAPLSGEDGTALRAALAALGYAPEDWCAMLVTNDANDPLDQAFVCEAIAALDPATLIACDDVAAEALRCAYAEQLAELDDFDTAMLAPGKVARVLGMRVMNLGGFAASLEDPHAKQVMWARLKQLPPLGAPY